MWLSCVSVDSPTWPRPHYLLDLIFVFPSKGRGRQYRGMEGCKENFRFQDIISTVAPCLCDPSNGKCLLFAHHSFVWQFIFLRIIFPKYEIKFFLNFNACTISLDTSFTLYSKSVHHFQIHLFSRQRIQTREDVLPSPYLVSCLVFSVVHIGILTTWNCSKWKLKNNYFKMMKSFQSPAKRIVSEIQIFLGFKLKAKIALALHQ